MAILDPPTVEQIISHCAYALGRARRGSDPFSHWSLTDVFPEEVGVGIMCLPIAPSIIDDCHGVRDRHNEKRNFFTPWIRTRFPVCASLAEAMQSARLAQVFSDLLGIEADGSYLRMEYIQDVDGAWLKPHCDVPEKLFSMVVYLCTGPEAADWGTDIYDADKQWFGRSSAEFNSAVIFVPGPNTWHGFEKRPIIGVRRLMEINYVHPGWRDRNQLSFPDRPISTE